MEEVNQLGLPALKSLVLFGFDLLLIDKIHLRLDAIRHPIYELIDWLLTPITLNHYWLFATQSSSEWPYHYLAQVNQLDGLD